MTNLTKLTFGCACMMATVLACAAGQSSTNYAIPKDTINAGVASMSSTNFVLSSSLGDAVAGGTITSVNFKLSGGFRAQFLIAITSPSAPTLNAITPGPGRATLTFTPPTSDGGSPITSYTATCSANGQVTRSASGSGSPLTVGGLAGGFFYSCSITATNGSGLTSSASGAFSVTPAAANNGIAPLLMYLLD